VKNFKYQKKVIAGQAVRVIESLAGETIECVVSYVGKLFSSNAPLGTIETYTPCVCRYLDFTVEAMALLSTEEWEEVAELSVVELYFQALSFGNESELEIVRVLVGRLKMDVVSSATIRIIRNALHLFFQLSEKYSAKATFEGLPETAVMTISSEPPMPMKFDYKIKGWGNRKVNSYLAECIARGVGVRAVNNLPQYFTGGSARNVPELKLTIADAVKLVGNVKSIRDKTYYALLAAGGARVSETLQVLASDIDDKLKIVNIVDPRSRKKLYRSMGLSMSEINSLRFKGRANQRLTLIEPFATMFWDSLEELYLSNEFPAADKDGYFLTHDFLFCVHRGPTKGKPLCLVDQSPILRTFKANLSKVGVEVGHQHDIRHMHISYLCNDIPTFEGPGLGVQETSRYVGHINIESTEVYNHIDSSKALAAAEKMYVENGYYDKIMMGEVK
jgi:integrase